MQVEIKMGGGTNVRTYVLTTDHPSSSHGVPVLVDGQDRSYGPWDCPIDNRDATMASGEKYRHQMTARAIAAYARDDHPNDAAILELVRRFEAVPQSDSR